jgi:hypothetical protein
MAKVFCKTAKGRTLLIGGELVPTQLRHSPAGRPAPVRSNCASAIWRVSAAWLDKRRLFVILVNSVAIRNAEIDYASVTQVVGANFVTFVRLLL